jgi:hypothetical protein
VCALKYPNCSLNPFGGLFVHLSFPLHARWLLPACLSPPRQDSKTSPARCLTKHNLPRHAVRTAYLLRDAFLVGFVLGIWNEQCHYDLFVFGNSVHNSANDRIDVLRRTWALMVTLGYMVFCRCIAQLSCKVHILHLVKKTSTCPAQPLFTEAVVL